MMELPDAMTPHSPGAVEALADNPEAAREIAALEALALAYAQRGQTNVPRIEGRISAALRARARARALLRRAAASAAAAAAVVAIGTALWTQAPARRTFETAARRTAEVQALLARQRPDGSWLPERGGAALATAATGAAVLRLLDDGGNVHGPATSIALDRAAAWLRAHPPASAATSVSGAFNLALGTSALLALYGRGGCPELFNASDSAVSAVRERIAGAGSAAPPTGEALALLAAALARADDLEWPDSASGWTLRRLLPQLGAAGEPSLADVAAAATPGEKRVALLRLPPPAGS